MFPGVLFLAEEFIQIRLSPHQLLACAADFPFTPSNHHFTHPCASDAPSLNPFPHNPVPPCPKPWEAGSCGLHFPGSLAATSSWFQPIRGVQGDRRAGRESTPYISSLLSHPSFGGAQPLLGHTSCLADPGRWFYHPSPPPSHLELPGMLLVSGCHNHLRRLPYSQSHGNGNSPVTKVSSAELNKVLFPTGPRLVNTPGLHLPEDFTSAPKTTCLPTRQRFTVQISLGKMTIEYKVTLSCRVSASFLGARLCKGVG